MEPEKPSSAPSQGTSAGAKPPKGFSPIPKSAKGGYRKKMPNGGYVYWYPTTDKKGRAAGEFTSEKRSEDKGGAFSQVLSNMLMNMLPPDKHKFIPQIQDLLSKEEYEEHQAKTKEYWDKVDAERERRKQERAKKEEERKRKKEEKEKTDEQAPEQELPQDEDAPEQEPEELEEPGPNDEAKLALAEEQQKLATAAEAHELEERLQQTRAAVAALARIAPDITPEEISKIEQAVERKYGKKEQTKKALFSHVVAELVKARATKYIRRVPTGNPKRPWRYYYSESSVARGVKEGETIRLGSLQVNVEEVSDDGTVRVSWPPENESKRYAPAEWGSLLTEHYGDVYKRSSERRARQTANAVLRYVPKKLLSELRGSTDAERMRDLEKRAPKVYARLKKAFSRAGMEPMQARRVIADTLSASGWDAEARAALIGNVIDPKGAWLAKNYRRAMTSAENQKSGSRVTAADVQSAVEILAPNGPLEKRDSISKDAGKEIASLQKQLSAVSGDPAKAVELLKRALSSPALAQIFAMQQAHPELEIENGKEARDVVSQISASHPRPSGTSGAPTQVYVAGANGQPIALSGQYRLVEAKEAIPSHDPTTFARSKGYPEGLQERAYHRDKSEQAKVIRNAQRMKPGFVVNTNPDALNGPPIVNSDGIVLGGNSRTMSMQRVYADGGKKAEELKAYLRANAYQMGLTSEDVDAMDSPILVRVVDTTDQDENVLVRAMNESFIQGMDPRTAQVAMGRRLSERSLRQLADTMQPDQTLRSYLDSNDAKGFVRELSNAGIIDDRNRNQYMNAKTGKLNEDGKTLVERILVGRVVEDPDLLSNTKPSMVSAIARAMPYVIQAESAGPGYSIRTEIRDALHAVNRMHSLNLSPPRGASDAEMRSSIVGTKAHLDDMYEGSHAVNTDGRTSAIFENLVMRSGPRQIAQTFRTYADMAMKNPENQEVLIGEKVSPAEVFNRAVASTVKPKSESSQNQLFRSLLLPYVTDLNKRLSEKAPAGFHPIPGSRSGGYRKKRGSKYTYWYPKIGIATHGDAHALGDAPKKSESKAHHAIADISRALKHPKTVARRIMTGVRKTAKELPAAVNAMGKMSKREKLSRHDVMALTSVTTIAATAAIAGALAAPGVATGAVTMAVSAKLISHIALKAVHDSVDDTYTTLSAADLAVMALSTDGKKRMQEERLVTKLLEQFAKTASQMTPEEIERHL